MDAKVLRNTEKIVLAGMRLLYAEETAQLRNALLHVDSPERLAANVVGLMKMLWNKSGQKIPTDTVGPAATMLLYEISGFIEESGEKFKEGFVDEAAKLLLGMLKETFTQLIQQKHAGAQPQQGQPQMAQQEQQPQQGGLLAQGGM